MDGNRLKRLAQFGQSPWYDNMDRRLIENGALKKLFEDGILGVTSNPTIFEKAVAGSNVYDEKIKRLKDEGRTIEEIYDILTIDDVVDAADMLEETYRQSQGADGYVSLEVLPAYAHDFKKTVENARYLVKKIARDSIMIKIPATGEGVKAIRVLTREGVNINATLIFSLSQYEETAKAYIEGLWDCLSAGGDISKVASVASVFVSRIDTKVDQIIDVLARKTEDFSEKEKYYALKGKIAVAHCKFIYQRFKELFSERNFGALKQKGGRFQRALWASTSTKNPVYSDLIYVDNLVGPYTVNTMPHQTVEAFLDHGRPFLTLEDGLDHARAALLELKATGIDLNTVCEDAQKSGIVAFEESFKALMDSIRAKMNKA